LLRAIILFKLEQLSILTVCFSGTTASVSYQRPSLRAKPPGLRPDALPQSADRQQL
jgi:hypothetical protein